jgi:hypothetical protein
MSIDIDRILLELELLPNETQVSLQSNDINNNDHLNGTGRPIKMKEFDFIYPIFDLPYINSLMDEMNLYRTRIMRMKPCTCYSLHKDFSLRLHIPLITNDKCFLVVDDKVIRYPADGSYYILDARKQHTAVNASFEERIHLIACVKDEDYRT